MFDVIEREMIVPNLHLLTVRADEVAQQVQPGQFIIVRSGEDAERIPLSVADWDRREGTVTTRGRHPDRGGATGKTHGNR